MKKLSFLVLLPLLASSPACGQQKPSQAQEAPPSAPAAAQPAAPAPEIVDPVMDQALKQAEAGDVAGALQLLESRRNELKVPGLSLLGALYLQANRPQDAVNVLRPLAQLDGANAAVLYNAARAAAAVGQKEDAATWLTRAAVQAPASPAARDLGYIMMRGGKVVEAYGLLAPWAMRNPGDGEARLMAASLALTLERPDEAEALLAGLSTDEPAIRLLRGRALTQKGAGAGAAALLQPLLAKHPPGMDLEVRRALAEAYLAAGQPAEAAKVLEGRAAGHPGLVLLLGRAQHRSGNAAAAMATLEPLAEKLPADAAKAGDPRPPAGIAVEYGALLLEGGRAQEAVPFFEKATVLYPQSREAWQELAKALDATGRKEDAQKARARADQLAQAAARPAAAAAPASGAAAPAPAPPGPAAPAQPAPPVLSANLQDAMRLMAKGDSEAALAAVQREIQASPSNLRARTLEVQLLLMLRRLDEALQSAEACLRLEPGNPDLVYQRGAVQMARQDVTAAEKDLRRALEMAPRHTAAMNDLAVLLMLQGKTADAQALLEQALRINPRDQMAAQNLKRLKEEAQSPGPSPPR